tara:strand:- start:6299 stop:7495 length:1197 start_codon:yes stop_codon:yes gene_type:complete
MSVAVIKQQSTLDEFGFRNLYNTPPKYSPTQQAKNVEQYMQQRRKENAGIEDIAAPPKKIGRDMMLFEGDDLEAYENAVEVIQDELETSPDPTKFPDYLSEDMDVGKLLALRDYFSRQTTLPEHMWDLTTEGKHFNEQGNILPGAIPPVNAVKVIGSQNYNIPGSAPNVGMREGYGLAPNYGEESNTSYENEISLGSPYFPLEQGVGFVSPPYQEDMKRHFAPSVGEYSNLFGLVNPFDNPNRKYARLVGIRGFGVPQDKAFARPAIGEGREGVFTESIPPERLVGVFNPGKEKPEDFPRIEDELKDVDSLDIRDKLSEFLPKIWEGRTFGLNNPALSQAEKAKIRREIEDRIKRKKEKGIEFRGKLAAGELRRLGKRSKEGTFDPTKLYGFAGDGND